jgi:RHS repeat-associated protein
MGSMRRSVIGLAMVAFVSPLSESPAWALRPPAAGAASAQTVKLPDGPASVRGLADSPSVGLFSGQIAYPVPLDLPAGRAGFGPAMSLHYSGSLGNGTVGVGWALDTIAIKRSEREGVPSYTASDTLELVGIDGGGRLVAAGDGTYRVSGHGQSIKIVRDGDGFVVWTGDGARYALGVTPEGRKEDAGRIAAWYAQSIAGQGGERIALAYVASEGERYLARVTWGPDDRYRASFAYEDRPDAVTSYRTGFLVRTASRLRAITVSVNGEELRAYRLTYDETFPLSRVARIRMTGRGGAEGWPDLTFTYAAPGRPSAQPLLGTAGWVLNQRGVSFLDVDHDGLGDLARMEIGNHQYRRNLGDGTFAPAVALRGAEAIALETGRLVDLDGDSEAELVQIVGDTWRPWRLRGTTWQPLGTWGGTAMLPMQGTSTALADVNGDGRIDVLRGVTSGVLVNLSGKQAMGPTASRPPIGAEAAVTPGGANVRFVDVNGDGLSDAIWLTDTSMRIYLGKGDGTFAPSSAVAYPWPERWLDAPNVHLADLNRDGLVDLVRFAAGSMTYYAGRPNGQVAAEPVRIARPESADYDAAIAIVDVNGNGSDDVVWSSPRGAWALDLAGPTTAGMLVAIDNGMGKRLTFDYASSATLAAEDERAGRAWERKLPIGIPVPVRARIRTGPTDPERVVEMGVRDGFWDGIERQFGGFTTGIERTLDAPDRVASVTETRFEIGLGDARVLRGLPISIRHFDGAGALLTESTTLWSAAPIAGLGADPLLRRPAMREARTFDYEGVSTPIETRIAYGLDDEGRIAREEHLGRVDMQGDERTIERTFASDAETWVRDRVCEEKTLDANGRTASQTRTLYGDSERVLDRCVVGKGWVRATLGWLDDGAGRWVPRSATTYDAWGNVLSTDDAAGLRVRTYDASALHAIRESMEPRPGRILAWDAAWDDVLGAMTTVTAPDGSATHVTYDPFGRIASIAQNDRPAHLRYEYRWGAPRPETWTYVFDGDPDHLTPWSTDDEARGGWRQSVSVTNGAGEALFTATRLDAGRWNVRDWQERDARGEIVFAGEPFVAPALPSARPPELRGDVRRYDALGRLVSETRATGAKRLLRYRAFEQTSETEGLAPVVSQRDGLDRIVRTERVIGDRVERVEGAYDALDRIVAMRLQGGAVTHQFTYDALGRLTRATDPDIGERALQYYDRDRLIAHVNGASQSVNYEYDAIGRVIRRSSTGAPDVTYHYDDAKDGSGARTAGRLAWVEEAEGEARFGYDDFGRQASFARTLRGHTATESLTFSPSGLTRSASLDGYDVDFAYDAAGRPVRAGDLWSLVRADPSGHVLEERFGNGWRQTYARDALGLPLSIGVARGADTSVYGVTIERNAYGSPTIIRDDDGVGLDHSATFAYDAAGRLEGATSGRGADARSFQYRYDELQNMITREASGPRDRAIAVGAYRYGERGAGPRQVTSIASAAGERRIAYDGAGRAIVDGDRRLAYDAADALVRVESPDLGGIATYGYGYDGQRTSARHPDGREELWLTPHVKETDGRREVTVAIGDRAIARITATGGVGGGAAGSLASAIAGSAGSRAGGWGIAALAAVALAMTMRGARSGRAPLAGVIPAALLASCASGHAENVGTLGAAWSNPGIVYFHPGASAGPVAMSDQEGRLVEERRYEPFGAPLDAYRDADGTGAIDHRREPTNALGEETDADTGWSYHGARWMAPDRAAWLTPDPPAKAPDPKFMEQPWELNPYVYARQNPAAYGDFDGRDPSVFDPGSWLAPVARAWNATTADDVARVYGEVARIAKEQEAARLAAGVARVKADVAKERAFRETGSRTVCKEGYRPPATHDYGSVDVPNPNWVEGDPFLDFWAGLLAREGMIFGATVHAALIQRGVSVKKANAAAQMVDGLANITSSATRPVLDADHSASPMTPSAGDAEKMVKKSYDNRRIPSQKLLGKQRGN